jgi:hypothetical protein
MPPLREPVYSANREKIPDNLHEQQALGITQGNVI